MLEAEINATKMLAGETDERQELSLVEVSAGFDFEERTEL